jgi:hypothetical protein
MAQGTGNFGKIVLIYLACGAVAVLIRRVLEIRNGKSDIGLGENSESHESHESQVERPMRRFLSQPFIPLILFLPLGSVFLPQEPWKHMTATLLYDVVATISATITTKGLRDTKGGERNTNRGSNPLGNFNYNPLEDPYYISNLDASVDPFIAAALEETQFTNIIHIVLESMRADSFPWQENGDLAKYIKDNYEQIPNGSDITTSQITPFIQSLAPNTISWETVWATIPFTHKAMLGRIDFVHISDGRLLRPVGSAHRL